MARVDDRRVISGIVHVLLSGGRRMDAPAGYGPKKTLHNRWVRWRAFETLAAGGGPSAELVLDNTWAKPVLSEVEGAHRSAAGGKGGLTPTP